MKLNAGGVGVSFPFLLTMVVVVVVFVVVLYVGRSPEPFPGCTLCPLLSVEDLRDVGGSGCVGNEGWLGQGLEIKWGSGGS